MREAHPLPVETREETDICAGYTSSPSLRRAATHLCRLLGCDATTVHPPNGHRAGGAVRNCTLGDARLRSVPSDRRSRRVCQLNPVSGMPEIEIQFRSEAEYRRLRAIRDKYGVQWRGMLIQGAKHLEGRELRFALAPDNQARERRQSEPDVVDRRIGHHSG